MKPRIFKNASGRWVTACRHGNITSAYIGRSWQDVLEQTCIHLRASDEHKYMRDQA